MKKILLIGSLIAAGSLGLQDVSTGHGGTYLGPGDTVPPGGGSGNPGGPGTPVPGGPSGPGPAGPDTPGPRGPIGPGPARPGGASTTPGAIGADLTQWEFWWGFNQAPYLNLKSHIHSSAPRSGTDDFFLGRNQKDLVDDTQAPSEATIRGTIVPALIHALENETNKDIVTGALIALAKIGDAQQSEAGVSEFEQLFLPFLSDGNQEVAETAAIALGILGNPKSIGTLQSLLMDDTQGRQLVGSQAGVDYRTRAFAAYGLGQIGSRIEDANLRQTIVDILWEVCESPKSGTRDVKVAALISMGLVPLDLGTSVQETQGGSPTTRQEQIAYLLEFFSSENNRDRHDIVRSHAPRSICMLMAGVEDREIKQAVVKAIAPYVTKRGNVGVRQLRQSASLAFGMLGDLDGDPEDVTIREHLIDACGNTAQQVKHFSLMALGQVGGRPGQVRDGQDPILAAAEIRSYLSRHLSRGKTQMRPWAGLAVGVMERGMKDHGQIQSASSLLALRTALEGTRSGSEVGAYAIACGVAGDIDAEHILLDKLENMASDDVRGYTAIGLGLMNSPAAKLPIQEVVKKSKYRGGLLKQAAIALGLLGDKELVGKLTLMLADAKTLSSQAAIASALGFIGDTSSVEPLVEMLNEETLSNRARGFAAVALGIVADKEVLPWNSKFAVDINYRANTTTLTGEGTGLLDIL